MVNFHILKSCVNIMKHPVPISNSTYDAAWFRETLNAMLNCIPQRIQLSMIQIINGRGDLKISEAKLNF